MRTVRDPHFAGLRLGPIPPGCGWLIVFAGLPFLLGVWMLQSGITDRLVPAVRAAFVFREVPCEVVSWQADVTGQPNGATLYRPRVLVRYPAGSPTVEARALLTVDEPDEESRSEATDAMERWPVGTPAVCFVDPADPGHVVMTRSARWLDGICLALFGVAMIAPYLLGPFVPPLVISSWHRGYNPVTLLVADVNVWARPDGGFTAEARLWATGWSGLTLVSLAHPVRSVARGWAWLARLRAGETVAGWQSTDFQGGEPLDVTLRRMGMADILRVGFVLLCRMAILWLMAWPSMARDIAASFRRRGE